MGLHVYQNFVLLLFEMHNYAWFHVIMCSTFGSVKKNQNHIFQKLPISKDLRKSAFANLWSKKLFEWIQNLTQNYVRIILSTHTSFQNNFFDSFLSLLEKKVWVLGCFLMMISFRYQHKDLVYSSHENKLNKAITGF